MRRRVLILAALLAVAMLAGCGGARPNHYYMLQLPAPPPAQQSSAAAYPVSLLVANVAAAHLYREDAIVYRTGTVQMGTYEYHRWVEPPTEMFRTLLIRVLRNSDRYASVQELRSSAQGEYILRGRLYHFEEVSGPPLSAQVSLELNLVEVKTGAAVWSKLYASDEPVQGKDVKDVVEALNRGAQRGIQTLVTELDQYFASHPPQ